MVAFSAAMWETLFVFHTGLRMKLKRKCTIYNGRKVYRKIQIEPSVEDKWYIWCILQVY